MAPYRSNRTLKKIRSLLLILVFLPAPIFADTTLTITSGRGEPFVTPDRDGFYDLIVENMFQRTGVQAKIVLLPSERALINADTGVDGGNIARIKGMEKKYTNLVMVPGKIIDFDFVAFTRNKKIRIDDWDSLEPYNVTFINGWKVFEKNVKRYKSLVRSRDAEQLFGLLDNNRADVALYDRWSGLWWLRQHPDRRYFLQPSIASFELYLYVNRKHEALIPGLSGALQAMKRDGTYQKIYDRTLSRLLK